MNPHDKPSDSTHVKAGEPPIGKPRSSRSAANLEAEKPTGSSDLGDTIFLHPWLFLLACAAIGAVGGLIIRAIREQS